MEHAEYWILDYAVEMKIPLSMLNDPRVGECLNKPDHGEDYDGLVRLLMRLLNQQVICAFSERRGSFYPDRVLLETLLKPREPVYGELSTFYGLTADGGQYWEDHAEPDWGRFVVELSDIDPQVGEVIASSREYADQYFAGLHHVGMIPVPGTERWETLEPWAATYWKMLPLGYRVEFEYRDGDLGEGIEADSWQDMRRWYRPVPAAERPSDRNLER